MLTKPPPPLPLHNPIWEYKVMGLDPKYVADSERTLNNLGEQGWELVSMVTDSGKVFATLKRRKRPT
jgi:hypothetical protein